MDTLAFFSDPIDVTIPNGGTASNVFEVLGMRKGGVQNPAAFTEATFSFHVSNDGSTFGAVRNSAGTAVTATTFNASQMSAIPAEVFGFRFCKIVSPGAEAADRAFKVALSG